MNRTARFLTAATILLAPLVMIVSAATAAPSWTWTRTAAAEDNIWEDVVYAAGKFVAVSSTGTNRVMWTEDPTCTPAPPAISCWNTVDVGTDVKLKSITFGEGLFVAVGEGPVLGSDKLAMTSPDGITWTPRDTPRADTGSASPFWNEVEYGNGEFVAVSFRRDSLGSKGVMTSPDGITWTLRETPTFTGCAVPPTPNTGSCNEFSGLAYGNSAWVAVSGSSANGTSRTVMRSTDNGATWSYATVPRITSSGSAWNDVIFANGRFIVVSRNSGGPAMLSSPDGLTWTETVAPSLSAIAWNGSTLMGVNRDGGGITFRYSTDPFCTPTPPATDCFTQGSLGFDTTIWNEIIHADGLFLAVASQSTQRVAYTGTFSPAPPTTTTVAPPTTTTVPAASTTVPAASTTTSPRATTTTSDSGVDSSDINDSGTGSLPDTGFGSGQTSFVGVLLVVLGLIGMSRRRLRY